MVVNHFNYLSKHIDQIKKAVNKIHSNIQVKLYVIEEKVSVKN